MPPNAGLRTLASRPGHPPVTALSDQRSVGPFVTIRHIGDGCAVQVCEHLVVCNSTCSLSLQPDASIEQCGVAQRIPTKSLDHGVKVAGPVERSDLRARSPR